MADVAIATNESYRRIAIERGGMDPPKVFVVRSGPSIDQDARLDAARARAGAAATYLVAYVGVMGRRRASTSCWPPPAHGLR